MLFMSPMTVEHMILHHSHDVEDGVIVHLSGGEACKHFNRVNHYFLMELRNIYFRLCTNRFNPFGSFAAPYFCWSVILTVYNLPLGMCKKSEFMYHLYVILSQSPINKVLHN